MRPGMCPRCGRMVKNLISLTNDPSLIDGDYCERCVDSVYPSCLGMEISRLRAEVNILDIYIYKNIK